MESNISHIATTIWISLTRLFYIPSENRFCLMRKSRFQKQYKQKKSPQRPQCHKWHCHRCGHFFLYACTKNGQNRSYSHYFIHIQVAENATSTGHAKRGSVLVSIVGYNAPYLQTSLPSIADKATADNPVLRQCTTGGTPVTAAMHAWQWRSQDFHTAVGKPTFPLFVAPPLIHPHGAARQYLCSIFLSASLCVCLCFHAAIQDGIRCHFRCMGQR